MIKGVNKQVLEISEIDNNFFEKAIFFVKPEYSGLSDGKLREIAKNKVDSVGNPPEIKSKRKTNIKAVFLVLGVFITGIFIGLAF